MKTPFRLRRRLESAEASAFLLESHEPAELLALCARLGGTAMPRCYAVAGGFLVHLPGSSTFSLPSVLRLRAIAKHLLVPVDADLIPALLPDEAASLTARRGLIFLPKRVLEYSPDQPLSLCALLSITRLPKIDWQPLPELPGLAERITRIRLEGPERTPEEYLEPGGEDIGTEEPQVDPSGLPASAAGSVAVVFGKALLALGRALHIDALARIGAEWIGKGLNLAPALSKSILGAQEAALRALLREFREGDLEKALRRALPFDDRMPRGSGASSNFNLPTHNTRYSLGNILAGSSGPAGYWLGGGDIWAELRKEYQKQAEHAASKGDYRRAAFIYGKLLHDFRSAANVLSRGGLHEDAAVLFLKKLGDKQAAAGEYEAAGNFDLALDLYRLTGQHGDAGYLLRRIGEERQAIAEYQQGADKLARPPGSYLQAGDFLLNRAQLPELALNYFELGWRKRPETNALPCALRMLRVYAQQESAEHLLGLIDQADEHLRQTIPSDPAVEFYNEVARLAEQPILSGHGEVLRDRALTGLAHQMRERVEARQGIANLVSKHLGMSPFWKPALVSDAHHAIKLASSRAQSPFSIPARSPLITLPARTPKVRAACWAPGSGDIFIGFQREEVFCYNPKRGEAKLVAFENDIFVGRIAPGLSLATDTDGQVLAMLIWGHGSAPTLRVFTRQMDGFVLGKTRTLQVTGQPWLCPLIIGDDERLVGVWNGEQLAALRTADLNPVVTLQPSLDDGVHGAFLLPWILWRPYSQKVILFGNNAAELQGRDGKSQVVPLGWSPFASVDNSLCRQMVDWRMTGPRMELLGVDDSGNLHWSVTTFEENNVLKKSEMRTYNKNGPIRAAAFLQPGHIAAVGDQGIQWLQTGNEFRIKGMTSIRFPAAVACFPNYQGRELIVINSAGTIENVAFAP